MAGLTVRLQQAIARAATLPPAEQDVLAALLLDEIKDGLRWEGLFADNRSPILLERLAAAALAEDEAGSTRPLEDALSEIEEDVDAPPHPVE